MALDDGKFIYLLSWRQPGFEMIMTSYLSPSGTPEPPTRPPRLRAVPNQGAEQ